MMGRALLLLACLLLAVPGLFIGAKGFAVLRRRSTVIQGKTVTGARAIGAGLILVGWAVGMMAVAAVVFVAELGR
jgi:hypothetical protein